MKLKVMLEMEMDIDEDKIDGLEDNEDPEIEAKAAFQEGIIKIGVAKVSIFDENGEIVTEEDDTEGFKNYILEQLGVKA